MFSNTNEIIRANKEAGGFFFNPDTMKRFGTRVLRKVYGGRYFITEDQMSPGIRRFNVRQVDGMNRIHQVGYHMRYTTQEAAESAVNEVVSMDRTFASIGGNIACGPRIFLPDLHGKTVRDRLNLLSDDNGPRTVKHTNVSGVPILVYEFKLSRYEEAASYLEGYSLTAGFLPEMK